MNFGGTIRLNPAGVLACVLMFILFILYMRSGNTGEELNPSFQKKPSEKISLKKLLIAAINAAELGGREVIKVYLNGELNEKSKGKTFEGANNPVTDADLNSHCMMYYSIFDNFPDINIISEEERSRNKCKVTPKTDEIEIKYDNIEANVMHSESVAPEDVTVWIDPLDATVEYTEKLLDYVTTMVCVAVKGVPVIGVIHKPFNEIPQTYWAWNQRGMSSSLLLLKHNREESEETSIIVSRSHAGKVKSQLQSILGEKINIIPAGGAGYKVLEVASSNVTAYIHSTKIKKWDICAGDAILRSLGGSMVTLNGDTIDYNAHTNVVNGDGVFAYKSKRDNLMKIIKNKNMIGQKGSQRK